VRLAIASCSLLLLAPAAAAAREPVISYVDQNGVLRLYDEQTETEVEPPPAVPAGFAGFRYGISMDGRYVVFNDDPAPRKLHLLDRSTGAQVPLPGIDVYANPGALSVSNTGLIAFDDNGNGPALVYDSAPGAFVDSGLGAMNGHRQTHLSGDGRFLGTTCNDSNCIDDLDMGADPYVQDLAAKLDTGFPDDPDLDEEHPCIDGDGSLFGIDKDRSAAVMENDIFLFDRSVSPPQAVDVSGAMDPATNEVSCVLDAGGEYLGFYNNNTNVFSVYSLASKVFLMLPAGKAFDNSSLFSAPYPPPSGGGPPTGGPAPPDTVRPVVSRFRMSHRRFRVRRRATSFRFGLSEPATVRIAIERRGRGVGTIRRRLDAGPQRVRFGGRLKGRKLRPGRYAALLTATDPAGNRSERRKLSFRVLRP
jgi:hypothetical protein